MSAYYNEHDPKAAAWLRELINGGHIAEGIVDERSIEDVTPIELAEFTQCHFFAGIGVWSYALRQARWPDDKPVWTGSCPCQPFSAAGKGSGFDDERHLWPAFFHLIKHGRRNAVPVFGEQVASRDGLAWLDLVQSDLEGEGYAFGALDLCAAGFGAPHIRQRLYWVADPEGSGSRAGLCDRRSSEQWRHQLADSGAIHPLADTMPAGRPEGRPGAGDRSTTGSRALGGMADAKVQRYSAGDMGEQDGAKRKVDSCGEDEGVRQSIVSDTGQHGRLADTDGRNPRSEGLQRLEQHGQQSEDSSAVRGTNQGRRDRHNYSNVPGPTNGLWRNADWLFCRDGKWRPVEPGTFPLAHGSPARVGRLRGYGNAIHAQTAIAFIEAYAG